MSLDGVRLTFPDDRVFRITEEPTISHNMQSQYLVSGFRQLTTAVAQLYENNDDVSSNFAGIFDGVGAGLRTITVDFQESIGSGNSWGDAPSGANAREKADELAHALTTVRIGTTDPITFEGGEYSSSGRFASLAVAPGQCEVTAAYGEGESPSIIDGRLELYETLGGGAGDGTAKGR